MHLRFVHELFVFDRVVQRLEEILGEVDAIVQLLQIITELLKGHFRGDLLANERHAGVNACRAGRRAAYRIVKIGVEHHDCTCQHVTRV